MSDNNETRDLTKRNSTVPSQISLFPSTTLDLSWLSEDERKAMLVDYTKGMLDLKKIAQELHIDSEVLKNTLENLSDTTREVSESGNAVTITHTQTTKVGRTEVIMGNTDQAKSGKLSKSQTGEKDWTPYYIVGAIVAVIIIIALLAN